MFLEGMLGALASLGVGWGLKKAYEGDYRYQITDREFQISAIIICTAVAPIVVFSGFQLAIHQNVTFHETWSGWEQKTIKNVTTCYKDGMCHWEYSCDPETETYKDSEGKTQTRTVWHDCPYFDQEWEFVLKTTAGDVVIAPHNAPTNPRQHLYRPWVSAPSDIPSGIPATWSQSKQRLDAGTPGPVAVRHNYENYILASDNLLKKQSDRIAEFQKNELMPDFQYQIESDYLQNRVYWVMQVPPKGDWLQAINRFNAAFGMAKQGDMHLVLVRADQVDNPDYYASAVSAYWQSAFKKDSLSKNAIVIVAGVSDGKISWARASTGMPIGNEALILQIQNELPGTEVTPEKLLGVPTATINGEEVSYTLPDGKLGQLLWKFERVCMRCDGKDGATKPGYVYLLNQVQPDGMQKFLIVLAVVAASGVVWYIVLRY
jgi:hypothetical protein